MRKKDKRRIKKKNTKAKNKRNGQDKHVDFQKVIGFQFKAFNKAYENFKAKRIKEKEKQEKLKSKNREKQIKEEQRQLKDEERKLKKE